MKKSLAYSLIAVFVGMLVVVVPLFLVPAVDMGLEAKFLPQFIPEKMRSLEEISGLGLAVALAKYYIVRARLFHWLSLCSSFGTIMF
ncbi:MAG: hypothetical protein NZ932_00430 [Candidatus Bathyarchaeota archaeon]|nr:hypothetical protein [Candidatus Bathyarchaeota archaeon]